MQYTEEEILELGKLCSGNKTAVPPPMALKMLNDLKKDHPNLEGKHVLISGDLPMLERAAVKELLLHENATITTSHKKEGVAKLEVISSSSPINEY